MSATVSRFLVDAGSDPVAIRIEGRASFQNSPAIKDFLAACITRGRRRFLMDFAACTTMDSTFLGVLAGAALQLRGTAPSGSLVLARLSPRNLELVRNLGLHRLLLVDDGRAPEVIAGETLALGKVPTDEIEAGRLVLEAHENLIAVDAANQARFQDVMDYLRREIGETS
jgi:anti-sigma B factor antagonist